MRQATTQYDDVIGTSAADWHEGGGLHELAKAAGIDTKRYFPVGARLYGTDLHVSEIYTIDTQELSESTGDAVRRHLESGEEAKGVTFSVLDKELPINRFMKRFEVVLGSKGMDLNGVEFEEAD